MTSSRWLTIFALLATLAACTGCGRSDARSQSNPKEETAKVDPPKPGPTEGKAVMKKATFGAGCFWCVEAVFQQLEGVEKVESGYTGGQVPNPTYEEVCSGKTGHAEVCQLTYDPEKITFPELLEVFWKTHDPTTKNRQGADVGTQYRSAIFYHDDEQRWLAVEYMKKVDESGAYDDPLVTEISPLGVYYKAENYHQNYYKDNPYQGYCRAVIQPKLEKFHKIFGDKLKPAERQSP